MGTLRVEERPERQLAAMMAEIERLKARLAEIEPWWEHHQAVLAGRRLTRQIRREETEPARRALRLIEAHGQGHRVSRPNWEELEALLKEGIDPLAQQPQREEAHVELMSEFDRGLPALKEESNLGKASQTFAQAKRAFFEELERGEPLTEPERQVLRQTVSPLLEAHWAKYKTLPMSSEVEVKTPQQQLEAIEIEMASAVSRQHRRQLEREKAKFTGRC